MTASRISGAVVLLLVLLVSSTVRADNQAREWLEKMSAASQSLVYSGTFVYQHLGTVEAMQILHTRNQQGERERLFSLTGARREVLRDNREVTCILSDTQMVLTNKRHVSKSFPVNFPDDLKKLENYYTFELAGQDRVAGLDCQVVTVKSRDAFRYSRRVCIHDDHSLLLRSELIELGGRVIEQVMFTNVTFPEQIPEEDFLPRFTGSDFSWKKEPDHLVHGKQAKKGKAGWKVAELPAGFKLTDHNWHQLTAGAVNVEHWVYSDGLASVSVYIEKSLDEQEAYKGIANRGALNAYGTMVNGYYVTAIGDVPARTVKLIASSVQQRKQGYSD